MSDDPHKDAGEHHSRGVRRDPWMSREPNEASHVSGSVMPSPILANEQSCRSPQNPFKLFLIHVGHYGERNQQRGRNFGKKSKVQRTTYP